MLVFVFTDFIAACSCRPKPELDIMSLNDTELVFTATLEEYSLGMAAGSLKFKTKQIFKGEIEETITIYFKLKASHTLFSKSVKFEEQKDWIVFARKKVVGDRMYYRLKDSDNSTYCALSRPVSKKNIEDNYIEYLRENGTQPDGYKQFFLNDSLLEAQGLYRENQPQNLWKYFDSDGKIYISGNYENGVREGEWHKYTSNSKGESIVIQKRYYIQGELREIHDLKYSGAVTFKKFLSDTAEIRHYLYNNGSINSITHRNKDDNSLNTVSYYKNGGIREKKFFIGEKLMQKYQFDENGQIISEWIREN